MARFATVSKNELEKLLADKDAENTKKATKLAVNIFTTYLTLCQQALMKSDTGVG